MDKIVEQQDKARNGHNAEGEHDCFVMNCEAAKEKKYEPTDRAGKPLRDLEEKPEHWNYQTQSELEEKLEASEGTNRQLQGQLENAARDISELSRRLQQAERFELTVRRQNDQLREMLAAAHNQQNANG
jgi:septal ring factor EnvC (AmiA/AmiB activator)